MQTFCKSLVDVAETVSCVGRRLSVDVAEVGREPKILACPLHQYFVLFGDLMCGMGTVVLHSCSLPCYVPQQQVCMCLSGTGMSGSGVPPWRLFGSDYMCVCSRLFNCLEVSHPNRRCLCGDVAKYQTVRCIYAYIYAGMLCIYAHERRYQRATFWPKFFLLVKFVCCERVVGRGGVFWERRGACGWPR